MKPATTSDNESNIAPADRMPHATWPIWNRILAYAVLALAALISIYIIDLKVVPVPATQPSAVQQR